MNEEHCGFVVEGTTVVLCLLPDHWRAQENVALGCAPHGIVVAETQHVCRVVFAAIATIERQAALGVDERHGECQVRLTCANGFNCFPCKITEAPCGERRSCAALKDREIEDHAYEDTLAAEFVLVFVLTAALVLAFVFAAFVFAALVFALAFAAVFVLVAATGMFVFTLVYIMENVVR